MGDAEKLLIKITLTNSKAIVCLGFVIEDLSLAHRPVTDKHVKHVEEFGATMSTLKQMLDELDTLIMLDELEQHDAN